MSTATVTEAEYRAGIVEMFKALDMDRNDVLDWEECRDLVSAVMRQDGGYNADAFRAKYDAMDKNDDGKISKAELVDSVVQIGRERGLFGAKVIKKAQSNGRGQVLENVEDDSNEVAIDVKVFRAGLS